MTKTLTHTTFRHMNNFTELVSMNQNVMRLGNEYAEELWFMTYPDGADFDDQVEMSKDDELMTWLREDYEFIMSKYGKN